MKEWYPRELSLCKYVFRLQVNVCECNHLPPADSCVNSHDEVACVCADSVDTRTQRATQRKRWTGGATLDADSTPETTRRHGEHCKKHTGDVTLHVIKSFHPLNHAGRSAWCFPGMFSTTKYHRFVWPKARGLSTSCERKCSQKTVARLNEFCALTWRHFTGDLNYNIIHFWSKGFNISFLKRNL